ncbi:MAG: hypothetical protein JEZ12_00645 [Desulfobacterium sp.]|nr:hypothetical protein [Desulfobacterium sp.]
MDTLEKIETVFDRYKTLQEKHIQALGEDQTDTARLLFERNRAFEDLKNCLSAIPGVSMSDACKRRMSEILEKDKILADTIKMRQHELSRVITNSQKGKKALKGYQGLPNRNPRFMRTTG